MAEQVLVAALAVLVVIALLFEVARRLGVPYASLFVVGGLVIGAIPAIPRISLAPELVLLIFLPPLLFAAAVETPLRDFRANIGPISRLAIGLVLFTMTLVAVVAQAAIPTLGWGPAFALGAIVAPTDALAATSIFRRLGLPRRILAILEGESLLNDATALVAYRTAVAVTITGTFVALDAIGGFLVAAAGGVAIGLAVGYGASWLLARVHNPPVEVAVSLAAPFAAYLPADLLALSGVLAVVATGLVVGRRLGTILSPDSRVLWLSTWSMVDFLLTGFAFVLLGSALPEILAGLGGRPPLLTAGLALMICVVVVASRLVWVWSSSFLPRSARRVLARTIPESVGRLTFLVGWSGLRGAVSLAAALALPVGFPERNLILLITFAVILVTLLGQGMTLALFPRWIGFTGVDPEGDELSIARTAAYEAGLASVTASRDRWQEHAPLLDRIQASLEDRLEHLATEDPDETDERRRERIEHEQIQREIIGAQRAAVIELRDRGEINDQTLRTIERELDLEELRREG